MRQDIKLCKLRGCLQRPETMQTAEMWSNNQAKRRPTTMPTDKACTAGANTAQPLQISKAALKTGVLDGAIPSAVYNMACTSNVGVPGDPFIPTDEASTKVLRLQQDSSPWAPC